MKSFRLSFFFLLITCKVYSQTCNLQASIQPSSNTICAGNPVTLSVLASGGKTYSYSWNTGETTPTISVNKAGTYSVTVGDVQSGCGQVTTQLIISSANRPNAPTVLGTTICSGTNATITATAPGGTYQWYSSPSEGQLLHTGSSFTPVNPLKVSTTYFVETTVSGCTSNRTAVTINVTPGPTVYGTTICSGNIASIGASGGESYNWYESATGGSIIGTGPGYTTTTPVATTTYYYVQAVVNGCLSERIAVPIYVIPLPAPPTVSGTTICAGFSANLAATAPGGIYEWFDSPVAGNRLIVSPDFTTPALFATTTYYVQTNLNGCTSKRTSVKVIVTPLPDAPTATGITICAKEGATLTASGAPGAYEWLNNTGTIVGTGQTLSIPSLDVSTTYWVRNTVSGCTSPATAVTVTVKPIPLSPSASNIIICSGSDAVLSVTSPEGDHEWFDVPEGGSNIGTGLNFTTPVLMANKTYYVQTTINGCTSGRSAVTVTILPAITAPVASGINICAGNKATLSATATGNIEWYDAPTGGNLLMTNVIFITPAIFSTTTYYVQTVAGNCVSNRVPVIVVIDHFQPTPIVNNISACYGTNAVLSTTSTGIIEWFDAAIGGNLLKTGSSFELIGLKSDQTFYVQSTETNCTSLRSKVSVSVIQVPDRDFYYPSSTYCPSGANTTPVITNPLGGTFSSDPGVHFVNTSTGEIEIATSSPGSHSIKFVNNSPCANVSSSSINITSTPNATFFYDSEYCQNGTNPDPVFAPSASGGSFTTSPAGLKFVGNTQEIDLAKSLPNTYIITNTINLNCGADTKSFTVKINPIPIIDAGPDQIVPFASTVSLAGSITPGNSGIWTGGTGTFSNASLPDAKYIPIAGETKVLLKFTANSVGICKPPSDSVTIRFNPRPNPPMASNQSICKNSIAILEAKGSGSIQWYNTLTGGTLLGTDKIYSTDPIAVDKIYYVQTTVDGVASLRTTVTVSVKAIPPAPTVSNPSLCKGMPAQLLASGPVNSTFQWYSAPTGGNLLANTPLFTTQTLYANTSFYVQLKTPSGCVSDRIEVPVVVNPNPSVTSVPFGSICSGQPQDYSILSDVANTTFMWSRMAVANISNPSIENKVSATINETLTNTSNSPVVVKYIITPIANGCSGLPFTYSLTVNPVPVVLSVAKDTVCYAEALNYAVNYNLGGTYFYWSRNAVAGISNNPVTMQLSTTLRETLLNTTNSPIDVVYDLYSSTSTCTGALFNYTVTVNPNNYITSAQWNPTCSEESIDYLITSNVVGSTFIWSRAVVANISNAAVSAKASNRISETLVNTGSTSINVSYTITPYLNGCTGNVFTYIVTVKPKPVIPINSNSPVCIGNTIKIITEPIAGAIYNWTGPNGFVSHDSNPIIPNAKLSDAGTYNLELIIDECASNPLPVSIAVNEFPHSIAGPNQEVCHNDQSVNLAGKITGGTITGIWTTNGTGSFYPLNNQLNAKYMLSDTDKAAGSVILTLTSTSGDDCNADVSSMIVTFQPVPHVDAGDDLNVCSQDKSVQLKGHIGLASGGIWSTSGSGSFSPSNTDLNALYIQSSSDIAKGSVKITLSSTGNGVCNVVQKDMTIMFTSPPIISAGEDRMAIRKTTISLNPTSSDANVHYRWTPNTNLSSDTIKSPIVTVDTKIDYTLTVTDSRGCVSTDMMHIEVLEPLKIPNTFTPNGDGINDLWNIYDLLNYPGATVNIYTRNGDKVFTSDGYQKAWDGTFNGTPLPFGTYYYIVKSSFENLIFSGFVTIVK